MSGTPRLRSAFPSTPQSHKKNDAQNASATGSWAGQSSLPSLAPFNSNETAPLISSGVLDAPSQRLYIAFFYLGLTVWRFYDYFGLIGDETESLWLFMKWVAIDSAVLYGLPGLRIPWLQWSSSTTTLLFVCHGICNAVMMFRIPIPLQAGLVAFTRILYDRELAVSERSVKPASVLHNASLILGKQIIHILPEGSAMLNPDKLPLCIDEHRKPVFLPIRLNQTNPVLIELLYAPFEGPVNKSITIRGKELSKYKKQADKEHGKLDNSSPRYLKIPVKDPGLYRLSKVMDESRLEVQRRLSDTLVVECPSASVKAVAANKCTNDLSNFEMEVHGVPPLKIQYSKIVNRKDSGHTSLTINAPNPVMPRHGENTLGALVTTNPASNTDFLWARHQTIRIPINESLSASGGWQYTIDQIEDACGNTVSYSGLHAEHPQPRKSLDGSLLEHVITVHERPRAELHSCDPQHEIKAQKGEKRELPIRITPPSHDSLYHLSYMFTHIDEMRQNQEHVENALVVPFSIRKTSPTLEIVEPGLYSLISIESQFCEGEIREPSTCLLSNPPEPEMAITHSVIPDRCDGKSVGLSVDLELRGTPPFRVGYSIQRNGASATRHTEVFDRYHSQIEMRPPVAGHYTYRFDTISDTVYMRPRRVGPAGMVLEQDIIPPASAWFIDTGSLRKVCIGEPISVGVGISGEGGPFVLEYELLHNGRHRKSERTKVEGITSRTYTIQTEDVNDGGEYTLALISIADNTGCKTSISEEVKLSVALQKPKASFGHIEGKRTLMALEGRTVELPLRLQGSAPWYVLYSTNGDHANKDGTIVYDSNDRLTVSLQGKYEIHAVRDAVCPGSVDTSANQFEVQWIPRPAIIIPESPTISRDLVQPEREEYVKRAVCEGDEDATDVSFTGRPPFSLTYEQRHTRQRGSPSSISRSINAGIHAATIRMETSNAGSYKYEFSKLGDYSYNHDAEKFRPITLKQEVYSRPSARFASAGKTYRYCKEEQPGNEFVPIILEGEPPFDLELEIKHHALKKPEVVPVRNIDRRDYMFQIPHMHLSLGNHAVTIRKVTDSNGCQRTMDYDAPHVQVSVADVPTISPLEAQTDYCVGDRIGYTLAGTPPFNVYYTFQGHDRKATAPTTNFRRLAEKPGEFTIYGLSDQRSTDACKAQVQLTNIIHEMPSVRVSKGKIATTDIHEGGEAEILFEFGGTPPFEFIYTRSSNAAKGKKSQVLETKSEVSNEYEMRVSASDEGVYEVVSIKDRYCSFSTQKVTGKSGGQKMLTYH